MIINQFVHHSYNLLSFVWQKKSTENTAHNHGQKENDFLELHRKMISHVHYFWGIVTTQYEHWKQPNGRLWQVDVTWDSFFLIDIGICDRSTSWDSFKTWVDERWNAVIIHARDKAKWWAKATKNGSKSHGTTPSTTSGDSENLPTLLSKITIEIRKLHAWKVCGSHGKLQKESIELCSNPNPISIPGAEPCLSRCVQPLFFGYLSWSE